MRHVALLIETSGSYGRGLLRGVTRYNRSIGGWSTYFHPHGLGDALPSWLSRWKGDGILARVDTPEIARVLQQLRIAVVNLRQFSGDPFPYVGPDHATIGVMAAQHLLERGLQQFAFVGRRRGVHPGLDVRGETFSETIVAAGRKCEMFERGAGGRADDWEREQEQLAAWIRGLPKPLGVMAANDERGLRVLDACRRCGAVVPDEVAVIGVDNDEHLCELSIPPMTSIDVNAERIGYRAAELLEELMRGGKTSRRPPEQLPPRGVVVRMSTDVIASEDEEVNRAIRFIREKGCNGLGVVDVLTHTGMSRASLQQRMKKVVGRTIHEEIERVRLDRVKELLLQPEMTIKSVARAAGFSSVQYMTRVFRNTLGETPAKYRSRRHH